MAETDEELVRRARRGDREAFAGLVERYEQPAMLVAGSVLRSWHDSRDAVQDAFVIAYEQLNRLWSSHKFGAWFLQIVRRCALQQVRSRASATRQCVPVPADEVYAPKGAASASFDLAEVLARLPEQECVVVTLRHLHELSVAEIAQITSRPVGTVTKQLSRAYSRMRPWLDSER